MLDLITCSMLLKGPCNYSCYYCLGDFDLPPRMDVEPMLHDLDVVRGYYKMFLAAAESVYTTFHAPGTEPLLHPQFRQVLKIVLGAGTAMLRTNLSVPISRWSPHKPEALTLQVTLHPPAEEDLAGFTDRVLEAMDLGVGTMVYYLDHPFQVNKTEVYRDHFAGVGVPFKKSRFRGEWEGKQYPLREMEARTLEAAPQPRMCAAGWNYVAISRRSELQRCMHTDAKLEKLLDGPALCPAPNNCPGLKG